MLCASAERRRHWSPTPTANSTNGTALSSGFLLLAVTSLLSVGDGAAALDNNQASVTLDLSKSTSQQQRRTISYTAQLPPTGLGAAALLRNDVPMRLPLIKLDDESLTCNDHTPVGYYIWRNMQSKRWLIFLRGGWYCFDQMSCNSRWHDRLDLMSSKSWPSYLDEFDIERPLDGILSSRRNKNSLFFNANKVVIPYCSSDGWTGRNPGNRSEDQYSFAFMGAEILMGVLRQLRDRHGLDTARRLYLAGSSAGAVGVFMNIDRVSQFMSRTAHNCKVKGIADSGWFLDNRPFKPLLCINSYQCAPRDGIEKGFQLWNGLVPELCEQRLAPAERWRCYFAYYIYPLLKTPVFVVNNIYDEAQIAIDNVGNPRNPDQWNYIRQVGNDTSRRLERVRGYFAPACLAHSLINTKHWTKLRVEGRSVQDTVECWDYEDWDQDDYYELAAFRYPSDHSIYEPQEKDHTRSRRNIQNNYGRLTNRDAQNQSKCRHKRKSCKSRRAKKKYSVAQLKRTCKRIYRRCLEKERRQQMKDAATSARQAQRSMQPLPNSFLSLMQGDSPVDYDSEQNILVNGLFNRRKLISVAQQVRVKNEIDKRRQQCVRRVRDTCNWPQCNDACPKLRNVMDNQPISYADILLMAGALNETQLDIVGVSINWLRTLNASRLKQVLNDAGYVF